MKRAKNLYPLIAATDNLFEAFRKAARGKRGLIRKLRPLALILSPIFKSYGLNC
jgi:hypothetical protein